MNSMSSKIDMLQGSLPKNILLFTLPIALASIFQQLFNAMDTSIIGLFDNAYSLAAVGTNGEIIALIVSLSSGLSIGANVLIARQIGRGETGSIPNITRIAILLSLIFGFTMMILGQILAAPLLQLIKTPENIYDFALLYLKIYFLGYPFLLIYDFAAAILRALGDSKYPFIALILAGILNLILNFIFVAICHFSVAGVALATVISTAISAVMVLFRLRKYNFESNYSTQTASINILLELLIIGIPAAIQGAVFCFSNIFVQAAINVFGAAAIAGSTIAMNFEYIVYYVITAFGQATTTFISQNYAARQLRRCRSILKLCLAFSAICSFFMILPIVLFPDAFSQLFTDSILVVSNSRLRIMRILAFEVLCCFYEIPAGALRGMNHSIVPAVSTIIGTCCFRIIWIFTVFRMFNSLSILYAAFPISWIITTVIIGTFFKYGRHKSCIFS